MCGDASLSVAFPEGVLDQRSHATVENRSVQGRQPSEGLERGGKVKRRGDFSEEVMFEGEAGSLRTRAEAHLAVDRAEMPTDGARAYKLWLPGRWSSPRLPTSSPPPLGR